jgi:hypothetical protein
MMMHGLANPKFINAKQAGDTFCPCLLFNGAVLWKDILV